MAVDYEIQRTDIDGVPVFWTPVEKPRMASLMFRVGRADEAPHQGGITHLVEHLVLAPLTQQLYEHNGFVSGIRTVFHASGSDDQLVEFIHSVVATINALPLDRTLMERRILLHEAAGRGSGSPGVLRWLRHGFQGQGLIGAEEVGLHWLGPDPIATWTAAWFTAENAAVFWTGEPPPGLKLNLPRGERKPIRDSPDVPGLQLPARGDFGGAGLSIGFVGGRGPADWLLVQILIFRLRQELRFERGLIYDLGSDFDAVDADRAHVTISMDCPRADVPEVAGRVLATLEALRDEGPTTDEIAREANQFADAAEYAAGRAGFLDRAAHAELVGRPFEGPRESVDAHLSITPDEIRSAAATATGSLLVLAPPGPYDERLTLYPSWSTDMVAGRSVRPAGWPFNTGGRQDRLLLAPEGVTWLSPGGSNTVRYDQCVAVRHWDGTVGGPVRELWGADGFRVVVNAALWRGAKKVIDEIDRALPSAIVACGTHGMGGLEEPPLPAPVLTSGWGVRS